MPPIAFNCYAPIFASYIVSEHAEFYADGASSFLHMLIELLEANRSLTSSSDSNVSFGNGENRVGETNLPRRGYRYLRRVF